MGGWRMASNIPLWARPGRTEEVDPVGPSRGDPDRRVTDRRTQTLWSLAYGSFRPRRRSRRRAGDGHIVFLDWHEPRVLYLALGIVLMSCLDALFTLNLLGMGAQEMNLLMEALINHDVRSFVITKVSLTGASVVLLGIAAHRHLPGEIPVLRVMQLFFAGYAALMAWEIYLISTWIGGSAIDWRAWFDGAAGWWHRAAGR